MSLAPTILLEDSQLLRYSRHLFLPQIDITGQEKLLSSRVLIIGLGGLGSSAALYLASSGIGELILNDFDTVDISNLQRQVIHGTPDIGEQKTLSAERALRRLNPDVQFRCLDTRLEGEALGETVANVDLVLDCSDNFSTRFAVNAACVRAKKPLVSGAVIRFEGQLSVFNKNSPDSPCYNCLYPYQGELAETCAQNGVIAPLPGIIGSLQALEAIKELIGIGESLSGSLLLLDALTLEWKRLRLKKNPHCATCGIPST